MIREILESLEDKSIEDIVKSYGLTLRMVKGSFGGSCGARQVTVSDNTNPVKYFAANWLGSNNKDFVSKNEYPQNLNTAYHEIAHGLFSRNPQKGHIALKELTKLGVPRDVAVENLADLGGLYLLDPEAITNSKIYAILDNYLADFYKEATNNEEIN